MTRASGSAEEAATDEPAEGEDLIELEAAESGGGAELLELILAEPPAEAKAGAPATPERIEGVVIGALAGFDAQGEALVTFPGGPPGAPLPARATVALAAGDVGREVALLFERGDPRRPLVMGLLHRPAPRPEAPALQLTRDGADVRVDGQRVELCAEDELVLRCGKASITLTRAGKILIRGAYVLTRSSGVNRIQGGSVEIN
jgi:hypothetical protein